MTNQLMMLMSRAVGPGLLFVLLTSTACSQDGTHKGSLSAGDPTLQEGEYYDAYPIDVQAGQWIELDLISNDFDTYVVLMAPSGTNEQNDDFEGSTNRSMLRVQASVSGTWQVYATSYAGGETGRYTLGIDVSDSGDATLAMGPVQTSGARFESGRLEASDTQLTSGEFSDTYTIQGRAGEQLVLDLHSADFDTYLILIQPDNEQVENDDHEGDRTRSMITATLPADGAYRVLVTSYETGETGSYDLTIRGGGGEGSVAYASASGVRTERGTLGSDDQTLRSGEYVDTYTFEGAPGQRIRLDLESSEFDTYLGLQPPRGEAVQDDDGGGATGHSVIEHDLTEPGSYQVFVTSYAASETGNYELKMDFSGSFGQTADGATAASANSDFILPVSLNAGELTLNETIRGALENNDRRLGSGEFVDLHIFDGEADEPVLIEMTSSAFDTYLVVTLPTGEVITNDDFEGSTSTSRIEMIMPMDGRYRIEATSYAEGEAGSYNLRINQMEAFRPDPARYDRIVGLFVGISDYGGRLSNLQYTARDASVVRDALVRGAGMSPADGIVLTDAAATREAFRQSLRSLASRTDENTLFVLFYSGHGGQHDRAGAQSADPDAKDESIELVDGEILDDELNQLLAQLPANLQLIVLDACYSGGFAKDVISQPGRMGLFSSEEDVISFVADKFEAGGYLSRFFSDALVQRSADEDRNGAVTPLELSQFIRERYNGDVRNTGLEAIVARETQLRHQHLVVDRGSLGAFSTLFVLR